MAFLRAACIALALIHATFARRILDPDGSSYLDIAKAYLRHDWPQALNSYWSPLYSWLLALCLAIFRPGIRWQLWIPHLISFVAFLAMIAAWEWLLREYRRLTGPPAHPRLINAASYLTLAWVGLKLNGMSFTSGDILVTDLLIVCAALLIRIYRTPLSRRNYLLIGLTLGFAFLTKAALLTAIPVILLGLLILTRQPTRTALATMALLAVIAPFITALSLHQHRFTLGDAGPVNYSWQVTGMSVEGYKEEAHSAGPAARHPLKVLLDYPRVLSLADHPVGWYPLHFDPAWWSEGYPVRLDPARQFFILGNNLTYSASILIQSPTLWLAALCAIAAFRPVRRTLAILWFLWLPALALTGAYCLVYVLPRYIAGPFALLSFALLAAAWNVRLSPPLTKLAALLLLTLPIPVLWNELIGIPTTYLQLTFTHAMPWEFHNAQIADHMKGQGLHPGDKVAYIGNALSAAWVVLDDAQIVAFIPTRTTHDDSKPGRPLQYSFRKTDAFWRATPAEQQQALDAFRAAGAQWAIADEVPEWAETSGWKSAGTSGNLRAGDYFSTFYRPLN